MTAARLGILGGTFDPIHCGHIDAGAAAQAALALDEILVVPSNIPPHRPPPVASSHHRFAMAALAIAGRSRWRAMDLELGEPVKSYTADTLRRLHAGGFSAFELFFITGADAFIEIATWKDYPAVLDLAHFAVVSRRGVSAGEVLKRLPSLADRMRTAVHTPDEKTDPTVRLKPDPTYGGTSDGTLIFLIGAPTADVSSTAIRQARAEGRSIAGMVPLMVQQHIEQHRLYPSAAP